MVTENHKIDGDAIKPFPAIPKQYETIRSPDTPIFIEIITDRPGTDEGENTEQIFLTRALTLEEEEQLKKAKTRGEILGLVENIRNLYEPIEYEMDFRTV